MGNAKSKVTQPAMQPEKVLEAPPTTSVKSTSRPINVPTTKLCLGVPRAPPSTPVNSNMIQSHSAP